MKKSQTLRLGDYINRLFDEEPDVHEHILEQKALAALPHLLGPAMPHILPPHIKDGTLSLQAQSAVVRQVLTMQREDLVRRINDAVGVELIREIRIL